MTKILKILSNFILNNTELKYKKREKNYSCLCGINFGNRKDNYMYHINRINPCEALAPKTPEITLKTPEITPKEK